ncbi:MAG TPA: ornithine cyclodeaminase family protein [Dermatophilaceae bacterium]|nr:ornithine cyclodeaminase family protein [Dermatophilaceae bacterium]
MSAPVVVGPEAVAALGWVAAVEAIRAALAEGLDPDAMPPRTVVDLEHGQGLLMPAEWGGWYGVKVATIAPGNPARGLDRISALYVLHDSTTLRPVAVLDGVALTTLRTPAVSIAAGLGRLRALVAGPERVAAGGLRMVVFGAGPQAWGHVTCVSSHVPLAGVTMVSRTGGGDREPLSSNGISRSVQQLTTDAKAVPDAVRDADIIVTATSAREPVLDGRLVRDDALVIAVGSHEPSVRELDAGLLSRSTVVVESREAAGREAGDILLAVAEGALDLDAVVPMAQLLGPDAAVPPADRPLVVKTSGMAWEDLVVAISVWDRRQPIDGRGDR